MPEEKKNVDNLGGKSNTDEFLKKKPNNSEGESCMSIFPPEEAL